MLNNTGFTKRLMEKAEGEVKIPAYLEGPYGHSCSLDHFEQVLLVCGEYIWPYSFYPVLISVAFPGGSGITFGTSNLIAIVDAARRGESAVRRVKLVWMIRDKGEGCIYLGLLSTHNITNLVFVLVRPSALGVGSSYRLSDSGVPARVDYRRARVARYFPHAGRAQPHG
jgi:hypothetical protein